MLDSLLKGGLVHSHNVLCGFRLLHIFSHIAHALLSFLLRMENSRLMMRINTNSTTPVAMRASRCRPWA